MEREEFARDEHCEDISSIGTLSSQIPVETLATIKNKLGTEAYVVFLTECLKGHTNSSQDPKVASEEPKQKSGFTMKPNSKKNLNVRC